MDLIWNGIVEALRLLFGGDGSIYEIAWRSLWISGLALVIAVTVGVPLGAALALNEFGGRRVVVAATNTGMAAPPVVVGLLVSLFLTRNGPVGDLRWLYTPWAMVIAQVVIALPIVMGLSLAALQQIDVGMRQQIAALGAGDLEVVRAGRTLAHVDALELFPGDVHVLLGANGAGKSTLLKALNGLEEARGTLAFEGREVATAAARLALRRRTAAVFQRPYLLAASVRGNVESGLRLRGAARAEARRRAAAALDLLGIAHLAERKPDRLSGGEAQRVSVARALAVDPAVLFLDEPLAALDPPTRRALVAELLDIFAQRAMAVVWVTHDRDEALAGCAKMS